MTSVAVVMPAYNGERFIGEALVSVLRQTHQQFTCCIVDDGSRDGTLDAVKQTVGGDPRFSVLRQQNAGAAAARNRGAAATHSDLLAFLDQDDAWDEHFLTRLASGIGSAPAVHCVTRGIDEHGRSQGDFERWSRSRSRFGSAWTLVPEAGPSTTFESLVTAPCIASPGAGVIRRAAFEAAGGFDPTIRMCEDWDLWIRLARLGPLAFVDEPLFLYRQHGQNTHVHGTLSRRNIARVRRAAIACPRNTPEQKRAARRGSRTFYRSQAVQSLRGPRPQDWARGLLRLAYSISF